MEDIIFNSKEELYERLIPALRTRQYTLSKTGYSYIKEQDIWEALSNGKWNNVSGLELCDMVDDILHIDDKYISDYYHKNNSHDLVVLDDIIDLPKLK